MAGPRNPAATGPCVALLQDHKFISAVKLYRERTGAGLGAAHGFITELNKGVVDPDEDAKYVHKAPER